MDTSKGQGKAPKTRKGLPMKKSTLTAVRDYLNGKTLTEQELTDLRDEVNKEYDELVAKAAANAELYATAHELVMAELSDKPMTAQELFDACLTGLTDFSVSKLRYALREMWTAEVVKHDNGKNPLTYSRA